jgi:hypothetical protein
VADTAVSRMNGDWARGRLHLARTAGAVALSLGHLACPSDARTGGDGGARSTRDSAGIEIVENHEPVWSAADAPRLGADPVLVIGDRPEPDYVLSRVAGAARMSDGRIVVADGASLQLRFFDSAGGFIGAAGGRGSGPGEFRRLDMLGALPGDTIFALSLLSEVTFFDPHGAFLRQVDGSRDRAGLPDGPRIVAAVLGDQSLALGPIPRPSPGPHPTRWVESLPMVLVPRDTSRWVSLGNLPFMLLTMDDGMPRPPWFAPVAAFAAHGTSLYAGYGGEYAIRVFAADGTLTRIIRRRWTPTRVTDADIDEYVTEWSKRWVRGTGPDAERQKRDLRDDPYASEVPAYSQLLVDRTGRLWVREAHLADAPAAGQLNTSPLVPSVWSVFDADGGWLGDVTMPARFMPTDVGRDYVLGIARDADGVETVVAYGYGAGANRPPDAR